MSSKVQLPDLWLKLEMALALMPPGTPADRLHNSMLVRCIRGDHGTTSMFNKWLVGDAGMSLAEDGYFMAAMLESLIVDGVHDKFDQSMVKAYAARTKSLALDDGLAGTIQDFGSALLQIIPRRRDFFPRGGESHFQIVLNELIKNSLLNSLNNFTNFESSIAILHGEARDWGARDGTGYRLARKDKQLEITQGNFIQYLIPPSPVDQLVFGFEIAPDANFITSDWSDTASWFAPQIQPAGKALMVLDEPVHDDDAYLAEGKGECVIQIVGVDLNHLSTTGRDAPAHASLPNDLYRLVKNRPGRWPDGYAETMAMLTYVRRLAGLRTRIMNKNELDAARAQKSDVPSVQEEQAVPPQARLYQATYRVI